MPGAGVTGPQARHEFVAGELIMFYLVYLSAAATPLSHAELVALLAQSRASNRAAGITGLLLYHDGSFLQVLEGEREVVEDLFSRIAHDPRHRSVMRLLSGQSEQRLFPDWTMAFIDSRDPQTWPAGYNPLLNEPLRAADCTRCPEKVRSLVLSFTRGIRRRIGAAALW